MGRNDVALAAGAGVLVWLWSSYGTPTRQRLFAALAKATDQVTALVPDAETQAGANAGAHANPLPSITRPDAPHYVAFRVRLPTTTLNQQVWVQKQDGTYEYVDTPSRFQQFGIAADMANVTDIVWGSARAFANPGENVEGQMVEWVRSDTPTGVSGLYPNVPSDYTQALRQGFNARRLVPVGPVGWAILKQQGIV